MLNASKIKKNFPILNHKISGKTLVYLDSASSTQKPIFVIDAITKVYKNSYANVHRGIYDLAISATNAFEETRKIIQKFINAKSEQEIIFTKNTTESLNLIAYTYGEKFIKKGDEIIVSALEHHANLVTWQNLCKKKQAKLKVIPLKNDFTLDIEKYKSLLNKKTKLFCITGMSNVTGYTPPLKQMISLAKKYKVKTIVDAAQSIGFQKTDVQKLDCDFLAFSAHKLFGPSGVGILYGKKNLLNEMPPFLFGGEMIKEVSQYSAKYNDLPYKFEAGTPNIADIIAFKEAIKYVSKIGIENIKKHEQELLYYAVSLFSKYKSVKLYTPKNLKNCGGILSFTVKGCHPHDIATIFNEDGICIRAGHHCAEPLMKNLKTSSTARLSFSIYNDKKDIDKAEHALQKVFKIFKIEN